MTDHATALAKCGTTVRATTDRIVKTWDRANATNREDGAQWYPLNRQVILELGRDYFASEETTAAVVAVLSPKCSWADNIRVAEQCLAGRPMTRGLPASRVKALAILRGEAWPTGPKVTSFLANLMGDLDAVTVDVWAARVAFGDLFEEKFLNRSGVYAAISHSYRLAARRVGVTPSTMQATTWIVARNGRAT